MKLSECLFDDPELYDLDMDEDEENDLLTLESNRTIAIEMSSLGAGVSNLFELVDVIREYADRLESLADDGYELKGSIRNGSGHALQGFDRG